MFDILSLLIGFIPLVWGANILTNSCAALASRYRVSNFFIGLTIVALGTSSPEISVNIFAAFKHNNFITTGNVLGSNIFNIAIILGITSVSAPLILKSKTLKFELIFTLLAALVVLVMANDNIVYGQELREISRPEGIVLLGFFLIFMVYLYNLLIKNRKEEKADIEPVNYTNKHPLIYFLMGLALVIAGGQLIVFSTQGIADYFEVSERLIAILFISVGTSLPELVTAISATKKGNTELAIGNILGSCIFNVFIVLGLSSLISPISVGSAINEDIIVHLFIILLLFLFIKLSRNKQLKKWKGVTLIFVYFVYISYLLATTL